MTRKFIWVCTSEGSWKVFDKKLAFVYYNEQFPLYSSSCSQHMAMKYLQRILAKIILNFQSLCAKLVGDYANKCSLFIGLVIFCVHNLEI